MLWISSRTRAFNSGRRCWPTGPSATGRVSSSCRAYARSAWRSSTAGRPRAARVRRPTAVPLGPRLLDEVPAQVAMAPELLAELGEKTDDRRTAGRRRAARRRPGPHPVGPPALAVAFDRPTSPGNIGTLVRSADAFGAAGVIVTGHAADAFDPRAVRASTGSLFAVPVVRAPSHVEVLDWRDCAPASIADRRHRRARRRRRRRLRLHPPTLLVVGNETTRPERRLAQGLRHAGAHPDGRRGQLPQRRHRRHHDPLRNHPPAPPVPPLASSDSLVQRARWPRTSWSAGARRPGSARTAAVARRTGRGRGPGSRPCRSNRPGRRG